MFRNKEIKVFIWICIGIGVLGTTVCLLLYPEAVWLILSLCFLLIFSFLFFTRHRYQQLDLLSAYLRRIANGDFQLDIRDNSEGELSILKNEIYCVTVTLYEQARLLQADKLFLSDTLSDISHQLKTPLTSMSVMADLLADQDLPLDKRMEFTKNLRQQLERLLWLVSSLLKISKMDANAIILKKESVRVKDLIDQAVSHLLIPLDIKDQKLVLEGDDRVCFNGDFHWSREALANIIKNSIEHTPMSGEIRIEYSETPIYTMIRIIDTGEGIAREDIPFLFDRFYKASNASKDSVGIGLAMSKAIVEKQGGSIEVQSEIGKGSCFIMKFYKGIV